MKQLMALLIFILSAIASKAQKDTSAWFDFWIGDWELNWTGNDGKQLTGTNQVMKILDGKVIQENFSSPSDKYKGMSLSIFNLKRQKWMQTWTDNLGAYMSFEGRKEGEKRYFEMSMKEADGRIKYSRMVFYNIKADSFIWDWESCFDQKTWELNWRIHYKRKK